MASASVLSGTSDIPFRCEDVDNSVDCPQSCGRRVGKKLLIPHLSFECPHRYVQCLYCHKEYFQCVLDLHQRSCSSTPAICEYCGDRLLQGEMDSHHKACSIKPHPCKMKSIGCNFIGDLSSKQIHEKEESLHLPLLCRAFSMQMSKNANEITGKLEDSFNIKNEIIELKQLCFTLWDANQSLEKKINVVVEENKNLQDKVSTLLTRGKESLSSNIEDFLNQTKEDVDMIKNNESQIIQKYQILENNLQEILETTSEEIKTLKKQQNKLQKKFLKENRRTKNALSNLSNAQSKCFRTFRKQKKKISRKHAEDVEKLTKSIRDLSSRVLVDEPNLVENLELTDCKHTMPPLNLHV